MTLQEALINRNTANNAYNAELTTLTTLKTDAINKSKAAATASQAVAYATGAFALKGEQKRNDLINAQADFSSKGTAANIAGNAVDIQQNKVNLARTALDAAQKAYDTLNTPAALAQESENTKQLSLAKIVSSSKKQTYLIIGAAIIVVAIIAFFIFRK